MTFIIRQITKRPAGEDIVRDKEVELEEITVGRATHHDIFLSDLRVGLDHLTIFLNGSRLAVEAEKDQSFVVKGRTQRKLSLSPNQSATIEVGPFALTFDQGPERLWRVVVERIEPEQSLEEAEVDEIFTLRGTVLSKRSTAWVAYLAIMIAFLAAPIAWFYGAVPEQANELVDLDQAWLSGTLSDPHANLERDCAACHVSAFEHVTDAACIDCHNELNNHADPLQLAMAPATKSGFDGAIVQASAFFGKEQGECADCHREHNGPDGAILEASSLCTDCHVDMSSRIETQLGDAGSFKSSHPNFHAMLVETPGEVPVFRRVSLESSELFDNSGLKFPHDVHLQSGGGVARQAQDLADEYGFGEALVCEDCHEREPGGRLFEQVEMEAHCQMCHDLSLPDPTFARKLPHGEPQEVIAAVRQYYKTRTLTDIIQESADGRRRPGDTRRVRRQPRAETAIQDTDAIADEQVAMIFADKGACGICHDVVQAAPGTVNFNITPVTLIDKFMAHAEFDHDSHDTGMTCEDCHEARVSDDASHVLLPQLETVPGLPGGGDVVGCRDCHGDENSRAPLVASACISCHGYHDGTHGPLMTAQVSGPLPKFDPARWGRISERAPIR